MDCRQMQPLLALMVGQDLPDTGLEHAVTQHLQQCPACRERRQSLAMSRSVLLDAQPLVRYRGGLWPRIAARLPQYDRRRQLARFNVWVPTAVAALACSLLVAVAAVEIQRKVNPQAGGYVRGVQPPARNLFVSDPTFAKSHGKLIDANDVANWNQTQGETLQPARHRLNPPPRPQPEF